ncbi:tetratricopeptide repeat protein [Pseudonocardia adelaidensis]|uniref:Tetratricopeptide repeat protein n=1 Tax=Pseudonocardia adelaidensis TaxID=648754 RepID=A0ABP9NVC0_9PSEU
MSDGEPGQHEDALRRAAAAGGAESAVELGILLLSQHRHEEGRSWLERAIHSRSGPEAAFHLGRSFYARRDDAEAIWLLAAHAGHVQGAMALAALLEETQRPGDALHWLREVAWCDDWRLRREAADRMAGLRVTEFAQTHAGRKDWEALWTLVLSTPSASPHQRSRSPSMAAPSEFAVAVEQEPLPPRGRLAGRRHCHDHPDRHEQPPAGHR